MKNFEAKMNKDTLRQLVCLFSVIATITVNGLANAIPFNGKNTGEISNQFDVYFMPSGYVFSIWGLIYMSWILFTFYQFLPSQKNNPRIAGIVYLFALTGLANSGWLVLWHYEYFLLTVICMLALLLLLIRIYLRLNIGKVKVGLLEKICVDIPFSMYLGWISVATITNVTVFLSYVEWDGFGISGQVWAIIMMLVATAIGSILSLTRCDITYMAVLVWAFVGIADKQANVPEVYTGAWIAIGLVIVMSIAGVALAFRRNRITG